MKTTTRIASVLLTALSAALVSQAALAQQVTDASKQLTREEVLADAILAKRAGLDQFHDPEIQQLMPEAYAAAQAKYRELRAGTAFARARSSEGDGLWTRSWRREREEGLAVKPGDGARVPRRRV